MWPTAIASHAIHLTEVCDTGVAVAAARLPAGAHFADRGCVSAALPATSRTSHGVELSGPIREDVTWQGGRARHLHSAVVPITRAMTRKAR